MAIRNTRSTGARRTAPSKQAAPRKAVAPVPRKEPITAYATKPPTEYHKAFARFIVQVIGYEPEGASSKKAAFLRGVAIATAARPAFQASDFIEAWRAANGVEKTGPKRDAVPVAGRKRKPAAEPEPVEEDDDFEDEESDDDFEDATEESDDDFDEDSEEDDSEESEDEDDDFDEDEEVEEDPEPAPKSRRSRPAKAASAPNRRAVAPVRKAAPTKRAPTKRASKPADDDDFLMF